MNYLKSQKKPPRKQTQTIEAVRWIKKQSLPKTYFSSQKKCPYQENCGGCQLAFLTYEGQLFVKHQYLKQLFKKYGKVEPVTGMQPPFHYRNKVHAVFKQDRRGTVYSGMYQEGTHHVVQIDECLIEDERARKIINTIRELVISFKIPVYNEDTRQGLIRHVLIRTGRHSGEILVVLVAASRAFPSKKNFVRALCKKHPEITSIVLNINNQTDNMVLGKWEEVLYGKGYIMDQLCGLSFKLSPQSFYQINPIQTEKLYKRAIALAELTGKETVIDAYCGIGTIGMIASKQARQVLGVELNSAAVKDAHLNKSLNHISNIAFYQDDAQQFMIQLAAANKKIDVVLMDPPRAGSTPSFMDALIQLAPPTVVYISCQPETLKRDLDYLTAKSHYRVKKIMPFDMFPGTGHVEVLCKLSKSE